MTTSNDSVTEAPETDELFIRRMRVSDHLELCAKLLTTDASDEQRSFNLAAAQVHATIASVLSTRRVGSINETRFSR